MPQRLSVCMGVNCEIKSKPPLREGADHSFESRESDHINWDRTVESKNGQPHGFLRPKQRKPVEGSRTHDENPNLPYKCR